MIERGEIAFENVLAILRFRQQISSTPPNDIDPVINKKLDRLNKSKLFRLSIYDSQKDHAETFLHRGVLEKLVEYDLRFAATLELDHDAHAVAIAFVANIRNIVDDLLVHQLRDAFDQPRFVHLIRNFSYDNSLPIFIESFDGGFGAHHEAAPAVFVGFEDAALAVNDSCRGEVWSLYDLQNFGELSVRIVHQRNRGIHNFSKIVRRNFRRHSHSDSVRAVDQQIRNARR